MGAREAQGRPLLVGLLVWAAWLKGKCNAHDGSPGEGEWTPAMVARDASGECVDELPEALCDSYLMAGWCGTGKWVGGRDDPRGPEDDVKNIRAACSLTCGLCKAPEAGLEVHYPAGECKDKRKECADWASSGECAKNVGFMMGDFVDGELVPGHCMRSCSACYLLTRGSASDP